MKSNLSEIGHRICDFARSAGCKVGWRHELGGIRHGLRVAIGTSSWSSKFYANTVSGKKRAFREFTKWICNKTKPKYVFTSDLGNALKPILQAESMEELELKLAVMGF